MTFLHSTSNFKMTSFYFFLLGFLCLASGDNFQLRILHNNDMHARFEQTSRASGTCALKKANQCVGGFARTAHVIREARQNATTGDGPPVIYLNAGDTYTGTAWYGVHQWRIVVEFLNTLMPDAMSFGNHEFDQGIKGVLPMIDNIHFPLIAANLDFSGVPELQNRNIKKSVILDVESHQIGVIGYLTAETVQISSPGSIKFLDEVTSINKESKILMDKGVKIIIALGHSGFEMDKTIAAKCPDVDIVIGGHTNTFLYNGPPPDSEKPEGLYPTVIEQSSGKKVPVVQAYAYTKYMGILDCQFNKEGDLVHFNGQPLLLDNKIPQDEDVLELLEKFRPEVAVLDEQIVGKSRVLLDGRSEECRFRECNFGNLVADSMVAYRMSVYGGVHWTDAPIGLVNGGGIRNSINASNFNGNISRGELLGALPFDNQIISLNLNGSDLWETLELGVRSNGETSRGEFLQVSGLQVKYDLSQPVGERLVAVKVRCWNCLVPKYYDIDLKKTYRVVTTSFLVNGGDGHKVLQNKSFRKYTEDENDLNVLAWYIGKYSPVFPEVQNRIEFVNKDLYLSTLKSAASMTISNIMILLPAVAAATMLMY